MPSGAKYISQFDDGSPVQGADLFVIERALASLKLPFSSIIPGTAGRVQIGGNPGLVDDANLFWDVTNHRLGVGIGSGLQHTLDVSGEAAFFGPGITYTNANWYDGGAEERNSSTVKIGINANGQGLLIKPGSGSGAADRYINVVNGFGTLLWALDGAGGMLVNFPIRTTFAAGLQTGQGFNLFQVVDIDLLASGDTTRPAVAIIDDRTSLVTERTIPLLRFGYQNSENPTPTYSTGGANAINDGTRRGIAFYSYDGANFKENFRILDDQTFRLPAGAVIWNNGVQVLGARDTGWTAQTAGASKADLGATPTVGALASWAAAVQAALTTHGILGA